MDTTDSSDDTLQGLLHEVARTQERGPVHEMVLNGCRVLRFLADRSVVTREEAGKWALENWRPSDHDLIDSALARETGTEKEAAMDISAANFFGFRAEVIAKGWDDPEDD